VEVDNLEKVISALKRQAKIRFSSPNGNHESVIVGYTASYAVYVHENLEMKLKGQPRKGAGHGGNYWDPPNRGQSKYLEEPARNLSNDGTLTELTAKAMQKGATVQEALYVAGLRILRDSQKVVPVDTGNLKASGFCRKEV